MKRLFAVICALMLLPTLANADNDMISVSELRKQVERMERWKQNYKDDYGRSIGEMCIRDRCRSARQGKEARRTDKE